MASAFHRPVLVKEVVSALEPAAHGEILDGTVGGGGHSRALLERYPECRILAVDRDPEALEEARRALSDFGTRVRFLEARFDEAAEGASLAGPSLSGALLDLGVSTHQIDSDRRGFTFRPEAPLDMRMSAGQAGSTTAAALLNERSEDDLTRIFRRYGEEPRARRLAGAVARRRKEAPLGVAGDLIEVMAEVFGRPPHVKEKARVFQALRIEVNGEMEALERSLPAIREALLPGGVFVVVSYHSLEDREVKNAFREWGRSCVCPPALPVCRCRGEPLGEVLTRRVVRPSEAEVQENPRARSARMRVWRKAA